MYGGVTVVHTGEGVTMTETTMRLREGSLEPKEISGYIVCTNKMLTNWQAGGPMVEGMLRKAVIGTEDYDFLRGDGVNKALGVINCPARIDYNRAGANAIAWADVYGMYARFRGTMPVWIASQTIIPQLAAMVDAGNHAVWISGAGLGSGAAERLPGTLMGLPLIFADRLPALGTRGDLGLYDLSMYLVKDGSGPFAASSEHILFLSNKTVFKIVWNVDGRAWLTEPIPLEGSTANTVSPFVVLN
jgi:HK97 family phage major capsid protein